MDHFTSLLTVSPLLLSVLFFMATLIGFIDSLAGGGGLLIIPTLMAAETPSTQALVTNKLQTRGESISSPLYLIRRGAINLTDQKLNILMTFIGSMSSALLVQHVQLDALRQILPALVIYVGLYLLLMPEVGEEGRQCRLHGLPFALTIGDYVDFYDGFFSPMAGSFYTLIFVILCECDLMRLMAHARVLNVTLNIGELLPFTLGDRVVWVMGFVVLVHQFIGIRMGSRLVLSKGQKLTRLMIVIVSAVMSTRLLYDNHGQGILHWLRMS